MAYLAIACRALIGIVFLVAVVTKVGAFGAFEQSVREMAVAPRSLTRPVARLVLAIEATVVVLVATPNAVAATAGLLLSAGLNSVFIVAIARVIRRGAAVDCRCFGGSGGRLTRTHVVRDAALAAIAVIGAIAQPAVAEPGHPAGWLIAGVAGGFAAIVVVALEDIVGLFRAPTKEF
jgi:hypothetical protein